MYDFSIIHPASITPKKRTGCMNKKVVVLLLSLTILGMIVLRSRSRYL